jgi:lysine/ornithine N-monooxygenase
VTLLTPIIHRYALERCDGEGFGDFCERAILPRDATFHSIGSGPVGQLLVCALGTMRQIKMGFYGLWRQFRWDDKFCLSTCIKAAHFVLIDLFHNASPNLNVYAEQFIQFVKQECFDHFVVFGERHLDHLVREYEDYYNSMQQHQGIGTGKLGSLQCRRRSGHSQSRKSGTTARWAGC